MFKKQYQGLKYINLNLQDKVRTYYGYDILDHFINVLKEYSFDKVFYITEKTIFDIHGNRFLDNLKENNIEYNMLLIKSTESDKTLSNLEYICNYLIDNKISKDSIVISFGGGVIGNISGLAAGLIYRGVRYIEIPTTFMGQTDSTLSNKQAVNGGSGKNQIGRYYAPLFVWSDLKYITTESPRNIKAAIVEGVKNTLIQDVDLLDELVGFSKDKDEFSVEDLYYLFETITQSKNKILAVDPSERGYGVILEYGHTFGHAIEFITSGKIIHGEAVSIGMCIAAEISYELGKISCDDVKLHYEIFYNLIFKNNSMIELLEDIEIESLLKEIDSDNKRTSSGIKYVILEKIGECANIQGDCQIDIDQVLIVDCIQKAFSKILSFNMEQVWCKTMEEYQRKKEKNISSILDNYFESEFDKSVFDSTYVGHTALYLGDYHTEKFPDQFSKYLESLVGNKLSHYEFGPSYISPKQYGTPGWWYSFKLVDNAQEVELFTCRHFGEWNEYSEDVKKKLMSHYAIGVDSLEKFNKIVEYMNSIMLVEMIIITKNDKVGHTYAHFRNKKNNCVLEIVYSSKYVEGRG